MLKAVTLAAVDKIQQQVLMVVAENLMALVVPIILVGDVVVK